MLVDLPRRQGFGKLESTSDGRCSVSVFHSILKTETLELSLTEISRGFLSPQTRVYVKDSDRFRVGRVVDYLKHENGLVDYEVRFPNHKQADFSEIDLYVRPWNAPEDPAEILAAGGAESQYLHDRRQPSSMALLALRGAAQGLTALQSSGIDFVPHQIAAVRRVLTDPIQRYLLADEVGLGKTIEAGLIIRQHLIDNPDTTILIATPQHLCEQWRSELIKKLRLDQFGDAFQCCSHSDLEYVSHIPDILVVDEAHHLVGVGSGPLAKSANHLFELAHKSPVLLLLSATPALSDELKFLTLLNLLDPTTHPLTDLEGFRLKLEKRRDLGRLLLSLNPDSPGLVLRQRSADLQKLFPEDPTIADLAPRLIEASRRGDNSVGPLCNSLKEHVADSYRIHQRLIRSRRADAKGWEFMPRGPAANGAANISHVRIEVDPDDQIEAITAGLEDWRFAALESVQGDAELRRNFASRYAKMLEAFSEGTEAFDLALTSAKEPFDGEAEIITSLRSLAAAVDSGNRTATMVESTKRLLKSLKTDVSYPKVVVFAPSTKVAKEFQESFQRNSEEIRTFLLISGAEIAMTAAASGFATPNSTAILVTDRSGEEGLNLNFADAIVHLDLPISAARMEQRIGRLDRFGRRKSIIRHRVLLPTDDDNSPWAAWFGFLANGLQVFNRSISDIQFCLDEIENQAIVALFEGGPLALASQIESVKLRISDERRSQDEQYALDRIALAEEPVEDFIQSLEAAEEEERAIEVAVDHWLIGALQIKKQPFTWPHHDPFKISLTPHTLIPRRPWQSEFKLADTMPFTWRRAIATKDSGVTLLRPGTPQVDVLERFTRWDDRGTAFVTWRVAREWSADPWIGFRLCFVIEPKIEIIDLLTPSRMELASIRRAQRYFRPMSFAIYVDVNGDAVTDRALLRILDKPYNSNGETGSDVNLGSRPQLLEDLIDQASFQLCCRAVRDKTRFALHAMPEIKNCVDAAGRAAQADLDRYRNRMVRRSSIGDSLALADIAMLESIVPSVVDPLIRLDAMGCFVIANYSPKRGAHA